MDLFKDKLNILSSHPILLAPLAGVSDHPFRRTCKALGADLTYVEMLSAQALLFESKRTHEMMKRHESEDILGVQLTGPDPETIARAVGLLDKEFVFDTIDINMGCPVQKVVKTGCGSALLKDPRRVYETMKLCRKSTAKPLSAKVRLGWDHQSKNVVEVAKALEEGGADWITVHGRTRSDDYSAPVDLELMAEVKANVKIPVIGNGNIFTKADGDFMLKTTGVDALMVSRGALGDPWIFRRLKGDERAVSVEEWHQVVVQHLLWQRQEYEQTARGAICMRKHLLWYCKGFAGAKKYKEALVHVENLEAAIVLMGQLRDELVATGVQERFTLIHEDGSGKRFQWQPKWDMDRGMDRGSDTLQL